MPQNYQNLVANNPFWIAYVNHVVPRKIKNLQIEPEKFTKYLEQDCLYLRAYAKAFGKLSTLTNDKQLAEFAKNSAISLIASEQAMANKLHKMPQEIQPLPATKNYIDYFEKFVEPDDWIELFVALTPCTMGYYEIGHQLTKGWIVPANHKYYWWISEYSNPAFTNYAQKYVALFNNSIASLSSERYRKNRKIFNTVCQLESAFFNQVE